MREFTYTNKQDALTSTLMSKVADFDYLGGRGRLIHRLLPPGPRGFKIVAVTSTGHSASFVENDRTAVSLVECGVGQLQVGTHASTIRPGDIVAFGPSERSSQVRPGSSDRIYAGFTILGPTNWPFGLPEETLLQVPDPGRLKLLDLLRFSFIYLSQSELASNRTVALHEALVEDAVIALLQAHGAALREETRGPRAAEQAARAADYIETHFCDPITVTEVAASVGVPLRSLQRSFRAHHGTSLRSYLSMVRLSAMRKILEKGGAETSVTAAALEAGLFHLGRSSAAYREQFGELPSETLKRASRRGSD